MIAPRRHLFHPRNGSRFAIRSLSCLSPRIQRNNAALHGDGGSFSSILHIEFLQYVTDVEFDRDLCDIQGGYRAILTIAPESMKGVPRCLPYDRMAGSLYFCIVTQLFAAARS